MKDKENDIEEMADELTKELLKANYNKIKDAISEAFSMLDQNEVSSEESKRRVKEMLMEVERLMSSLAYTGSPALRNAVLEFCKQSNDKDRENAIDDVSTVFEEIVRLRTDPIMEERLYPYVKKSGHLRDVYWLVNFAINPMEVAITILSDYETVEDED